MDTTVEKFFVGTISALAISVSSYAYGLPSIDANKTKTNTVSAHAPPVSSALSASSNNSFALSSSDQYPTDYMTDDKHLVDLYKNRLSEEQLSLFAELVGSLALVDSADADRFGYASE